MEKFGVVTFKAHPFRNYKKPLYCIGFNRLGDECEPLCDEDTAFGVNLSLKDYLKKMGEIAGDTITYTYTTDYGHDLTDTYIKDREAAKVFADYLNSLVA